MWPFEKKEVEVPEVEPKKIWSIDIFLRNGVTIGWTNQLQTRNHPWLHFYKWYFGRPQSKYYRFLDKTGETVVLRDEITRIRIERKVHPRTGELPPR